MTRLAVLTLCATLALGAVAFAAPGIAMPEHHRANRETRALNLLEAKGYGDFSGFHRDGQNFAAMVLSQNKPVRVIVNPDAGTVTKQS